MKPHNVVIRQIENSEPRELQSATLPGDAYTVPQRVSLHRTYRAGEWVTHRENTADNSRFWGHYFTADDTTGGEVGAFRRAFRDYVKRCGELGVEPFPVAVRMFNGGHFAGGLGKFSADPETGMTAYEARQLNRQGICAMD